MKASLDPFPTFRRYLEESGLLVNATEEAINAARKAYRTRYKTRHKRIQREQSKEVGVLLHRDQEYPRIAAAAKKHQKSIPFFLKSATLAYMDRTYIPVDRMILYRLNGMLSDCLNEIRSLSQVKGRQSFFIEDQYVAMEKTISGLEERITRLFTEPIEIEKAMLDAVHKNPELRERLIAILSTQPDADRS